ncbi:MULTISPECIES: DUF2845 domain-containing protein [unclassified Acidovorax]|uniref:DUF2845 domain-containing protein n=1 Tax=unclassified Acidovorax TaxID=2684926 RepID=UPI001C493276|nr:DUF2845 domain-containing protein [Acidovorax sp. sif0732]MBV7449305.1 DUF2845 domain-containing protein [Acidovorax sp. sif0715]
MEILIVLVIGGAVALYIAHLLNERRRAALMAKYGDAEIVSKIMKKVFWQGQTGEQLRDSLGAPEDVDTKVMKTRHREIWKYNNSGKNRYRLRITLENGHVVGWDQK